MEWAKRNIKMFIPHGGNALRGALQRILKKVITMDPRLGPVYLSKVDLADAYMSLWVRMEDVPSIAFLSHK